IIGAGVRNTQRDDLGDIEDLVVDTNTGHSAFAELAAGGFLGMGERLHAVPFQALDIRQSDSSNRQMIVLDVNKDRLRSAPTLDRNNWPTTLDQRFTSDL